MENLKALSYKLRRDVVEMIMAGKAGQLSRAPEPGSPLGMMMSGVREAMP